MVEEAVHPGTTGAERIFRLPDPRRATRADWVQLVRFCAVGTSGYFVNLVVFTLLVSVLDAHYAPAAVGAFCVAWLNNFALNKFWTFRRHGVSAAEQAVRYLVVSLLGLGLNVGILHLLVQGGLPEVPAQAAAIVLVTPASFLLTRRWAFR